MKERFLDDKQARTEVFPARFESLDHIREFVKQAAIDSGFDASAVYAIQLAVDEGCSNIIEHAYGGECAEDIQCTCQIAKDGLTITLRDCGKPFNPLEVPEPDLDANLEERQEGGLGLYFMHQLMDKVQFEFIPATNTQKGCNVLILFKQKK